MQGADFRVQGSGLAPNPGAHKTLIAITYVQYIMVRLDASTASAVASSRFFLVDALSYGTYPSSNPSAFRMLTLQSLLYQANPTSMENGTPSLNRENSTHLGPLRTHHHES